MKVSKWVDMGQEVEVDIDANDIRAALAEAFANVTKDRLGEEKPSVYDINVALNSVAAFLNAITDEHVALLKGLAREFVAKYLRQAADRFALPASETQEKGL